MCQQFFLAESESNKTSAENDIMSKHLRQFPIIHAGAKEHVADAQDLNKLLFSAIVQNG